MGNSLSETETKKPYFRFVARELYKEKYPVPEVEDGYPAICPPSTPTEDVYDREMNREIHQHSLLASADIDDSWLKLVQYLTSRYFTDAAKVRSIFTWLGLQDIEHEKNGRVRNAATIDDVTPKGYKKLIKKGKGSYATMFALLCRKAGIKCAIINGISKGEGYSVGTRNVKRLRDRWNAVYIDGWRLVHPSWAYQCSINYKEGTWVPNDENNGEEMELKELTADNDDFMKLEQFFNDYYFFTDPNEFINICLPDNEKWQLLPRTKTLDKWLSLPYLMSRYHLDGYSMNSEFRSTLKAKNGICSLSISSNSNNQIDFQLAYDFFFNYMDAEPDEKKVFVLKKYIMMARDKENNQWSFEARMPIAGTYRLTVYGGSCHQRRLPWLFDIAMKCLKHMIDVRPYPARPKIGFGPVCMTEKAGLYAPSFSNGMLFCKVNQLFHVTFKLDKQIKTKVKLIGRDFPDDDLNEWISHACIQVKKHYVFDIEVNLRKDGEFALRIYTLKRHCNSDENGEDEGNVKWQNVCNYYISTDTPRKNGMVVADKGYKTATELNAERTRIEVNKGSDLYELKATVTDNFSKASPEDGQSFGKASNTMEYLELAKGLTDAIKSGEIDRMHVAIVKAQDSYQKEKLLPLITQAQNECLKHLPEDGIQKDSNTYTDET